MTQQTKLKVSMLIFSLVLSIGGYWYLFSQNWKMAVAIFVVIWANNISTKYGK